MKNKMIIILTLLLALVIGFTFAMLRVRRYGLIDLSAAKWRVSFSKDDTELTEETVISLSDVTWTNDSTFVKEGKIAPGSYTTFNILIDASGTETSVDYNISSSFSESNFEVVIGDNNVSRAGTINYSENENDMKLLVPITIRWLGSSQDNTEKDNLDLSFKNTTLDIPLQIIAAQKLDENPVIVRPPIVYTYATFDKGTTVNAKMKSLAGDSNTGKTATDTNIKSIVRASTISDENRVSENIISSSSSENGIYMWFDNGTIYYYTDADKISLSSDSSYLFSGLTKLTSLDSNFDTSNVTNMKYMFNKLNSIKSLDLGSFDTSNVKDMSYMFSECKSLLTLNLSNFNTSLVENMSYMFSNTQKLTNLNVSSFDTRSVTTMANMFYNMYVITKLDLSSFETPNVKYLDSLFNGCKKVTDLDISNFNTENVISMTRVFSSMESLQSLDISHFDTRSVTTMEAMLNNLHSVRTIYVSDKFVLTNVTNGDRMFLNDYNLVGGNGMTYDPEKINLSYAYVDSDEHPGYLTLK